MRKCPGCHDNAQTGCEIVHVPAWPVSQAGTGCCSMLLVRHATQVCLLPNDLTKVALENWCAGDLTE